jgi:ketosteroid isomerase-like protein
MFKREFPMNSRLIGVGLIALLLLGAPSWALAVDYEKAARDQFATLNAGMSKSDMDKAASIFSEDAVLIHPVAGELKGRTAIRNLLASFDKDWKDMKWTIKWLSAQGNKVGLQFDWEGTQKSSGKHVLMHIALLEEIDNAGKRKWSYEFFDTGAFAKQLE